MTLDGVDLRWAQFGGDEFVRRLCVAVRDTAWGTLPPVVSRLDVDGGDDGFAVRLHAVHRDHAIWFEWDGEISGDSSGRLTYSMDGLCLASFLYNRIGICLLHPPATAGAAFSASTPEGVLTGVFPDQIGPQRIVRGTILALFPAFDRLELATSSMDIRCEFSGDLFETEDQRNWTDASFKTYSTPLTCPIPHQAILGMKLSQRVVVVPKPRTHRRRAVERDEIVLALEQDLGRSLPPIGLTITPEASAPSSAELQLLREVAPAHLRIDLGIGEADPGRRLDAADELADRLGCLLEVALQCGIDTIERLDELEFSSRVRRLVLLELGRPVTSDDLVRAVRERLSDRCPVIAAGTSDSFVELNRGGELPLSAHELCYAINPQVHASDDMSLVESLAAQADTVVSARVLGNGRPVVVGPVTLLPRSFGVDPRQHTDFAGAWTLGSIKHLAESGAASVTYFETTGRHGIVDVAAPRLPIHAALRLVARLPAGTVIATSSSSPLGVQSLAIRAGTTTVLVAANLSPRTQRCVLSNSDVHFSLRPFETAEIEVD